MDWKMIDEIAEPKDGDQIWAYLFDVGIHILEYQSAEAAAMEFGGSPEQYDGEWCKVGDHMETWKPRYFLPLDAIPMPPAKE